MTTTELKNIANANNLRLVKVGNFDEAITDFENFAQAEKIAEENELDIVIIRKKMETLNMIAEAFTKQSMY